jgi:putative transposase
LPSIPLLYYTFTLLEIGLVSELHHKTAKLLCSQYHTILIPTFEVSQMVEKPEAGFRVLNNTSVRKMLTWSHYTFRTLLKAKARESGHCRVLEVDEAYTSKTCTRCGHLHDTLGGNKTFSCPSCGLTIDRDWNGARNILLKNSDLL